MAGTGPAMTWRGMCVDLIGTCTKSPVYESGGRPPTAILLRQLPWRGPQRAKHWRQGLDARLVPQRHAAPSILSAVPRPRNERLGFGMPQPLQDHMTCTCPPSKSASAGAEPHTGHERSRPRCTSCFSSAILKSSHSIPRKPRIQSGSRRAVAVRQIADRAKLRIWELDPG
jgi:hypothetical protein